LYKTLRLSLAALVSAGMLLSGCSGQSGSSPSDGSSAKSGADAAKAGGNVTITLWNRIQTDLFDSTVAGFEKANPNIKVKIENLPSAGGDVAQYQAAINGNELPDLFVRPTGYTIAQLVKLNKLHSMDEVFPANVQSQFTDGTFAEGYGKIGGVVYSFPLYSALHGALMMYYNKSVLKELDIKEDKLPKTWDELIAFGKDVQMKSGGKKYALTFGAATNYMSTFLMNQLAPTISPETGFDYKKGVYTYNTPGMLESMEYLKKLYDQKILHPATLDADTGKSYTLMKTGEAVFVIGGNWTGGSLPDSKSTPPFTHNDWGVIKVPTKTGGPSFQYFEGGSGESLYANKDTKHWPEVKLFLQYMNEHIYPEVVKAGGTLPSKKVEFLPGAKDPYDQYKTIAKIMSESKLLTPTVFMHNPAAADTVAQYASLGPRENVGTIFLGYLTGQIKDLPKTLQKLSDDNNSALKKAIDQSGGKVKQADFVFADWVPGKPYKK
jgi:raffinose/stachyose/melibiose transport system substrate-binding protein